MAATLDDILTTQKNGVIGINQIYNTMLLQGGKVNSLEVSASKVISDKAGWIARVSVIVAGSTTGTLYDASSITSGVGVLAATGNRVAIVSNTVGIQTIDIPVANGIVFIPGSGMIAVVTYS
jgi:hypothetical protein